MPERRPVANALPDNIGTELAVVGSGAVRFDTTPNITMAPPELRCVGISYDPSRDAYRLNVQIGGHDSGIRTIMYVEAMQIHSALPGWGATRAGIPRAETPEERLMRRVREREPLVREEVQEIMRLPRVVQDRVLAAAAHEAVSNAQRESIVMYETRLFAQGAFAVDRGAMVEFGGNIIRRAALDDELRLPESGMEPEDL